MKKYISILLALVVILGCSVVAFADFVPMPSDPDAYDPEYIPAIPDFITPDTNPSTTGSLFDTSLDIEGSWGTDEQTFWDHFYSTNSPYLVLLSQGVYNRYNEEKGVQYDRQYEVLLPLCLQFRLLWACYQPPAPAGDGRWQYHALFTPAKQV